MIVTNEAKEKLKKYYRTATGKDYNFDVDFDTNVSQSGVSGTALDTLKAKTRAYLDAYKTIDAANDNYASTIQGIQDKQINGMALRDMQIEENNKVAMRQASTAGANYEILKRYLPELNAQNGKGNLGVGSSSYTDAYAAYMSALGNSAADASEKNNNIMQNYIDAQGALDSEKASAEREKRNMYLSAEKELNKYIGEADEREILERKAAEEKDNAKNESVKEAVYSILNQYLNADGRYTQEGIAAATDYASRFATSEEAAKEITEKFIKENYVKFDKGAQLEYAESEEKRNELKAEKYKSELKSGIIYGSGTCTIKFPDGSPFKNNDTTVTLHSDRSVTPSASIMEHLPKGQACIYNGNVYVSNGKKLFRVVHYSGDSVYDKLYAFLRGTKYDFTIE